MTNAARGKDRANVFEGLPQTVTHLVYIIPLLLSHWCTHIVRRHLRLVEQPLKNEQGRCEFLESKHFSNTAVSPLREARFNVALISHSNIIDGERRG